MAFRRYAVAFTLVVFVVGLSFCFEVDDVSAVGTLVNGSGTSGRIAKFTGSDCIGNSVIREDASGNVGIFPPDKARCIGIGIERLSQEASVRSFRSGAPPSFFWNGTAGEPLSSPGSRRREGIHHFAGISAERLLRCEHCRQSGARRLPTASVPYPVQREPLIWPLGTPRNTS